ncbi:hypothetical protein [Domibacillus iocasae]|uniref:hypothetical protein n=1 Tax=Domibacillus iocasae TaxID=1714016 RepID=UPI001471E7A4|nr:hypothetical protein [Domibacillus iocasae]
MGISEMNGPVLREILEELKKLNAKVDQLADNQNRKDTKDRLEKTVDDLKKKL